VRKKPLVLIVEDDALIRWSAVDMLEEAGFVTLAASNADEAMQLLEQRSDIRLVFTDIELPGSMNGLKLAAAIRDRWPPVQLVVTSGDYRLNEQDLPLGVPFFPKPYDPTAISSQIWQLVT
jgi:CheY-like chemotaxis protein